MVKNFERSKNKIRAIIDIEYDWNCVELEKLNDLLYSHNDSIYLRVKKGEKRF